MNNLNSVIAVRQFAVEQATQIVLKSKFPTCEDVVTGAKLIEEYVRGKIKLPAVVQSSDEILYKAMSDIINKNDSEVDKVAKPAAYESTGENKLGITNFKVQ